MFSFCHRKKNNSFFAGLFNKAIAMSGLGTAPFNEPTKDPLSLARAHAKAIGIGDDSTSAAELVRNLRSFIDVKKLVSASASLKVWDIDPLTLYRTVVEPDLPGAFLTKRPTEVWENGEINSVPFMTSVVVNEGVVRSAAILVNATLLADFNAKNEDDQNMLLLDLMEIKPNVPSNAREIKQKLVDRYLKGSKKVNADNDQGFQDVKLFPTCFVTTTTKYRFSFNADVHTSCLLSSIE